MCIRDRPSSVPLSIWEGIKRDHLPCNTQYCSYIVLHNTAFVKRKPGQLLEAARVSLDLHECIDFFMDGIQKARRCVRKMTAPDSGVPIHPAGGAGSLYQLFPLQNFSGHWADPHKATANTAKHIELRSAIVDQNMWTRLAVLRLSLIHI